MLLKGGDEVEGFATHQHFELQAAFLIGESR